MPIPKLRIDPICVFMTEDAPDPDACSDDLQIRWIVATESHAGVCGEPTKLCTGRVDLRYRTQLDPRRAIGVQSGSRARSRVAVFTDSWNAGW